MEHNVEILIVEDNPDDVEMTLHSLRQHNLANLVRVVRDGEEALDFIFCRGPFGDRSFEDPPKLILLDLKLPKVDGVEVMRQIKGDPRAKTIPVVILTSSKEDKDLVNGYRQVFAKGSVTDYPLTIRHVGAGSDVLQTKSPCVLGVLP